MQLPFWGDVSSYFRCVAACFFLRSSTRADEGYIALLIGYIEAMRAKSPATDSKTMGSA